MNWYYHPESDSVFPANPPAEGQSVSIDWELLVELGPVVEGTMLEILSILHQHKIPPMQVTIDRSLWAK